MMLLKSTFQTDARGLNDSLDGKSGRHASHNIQKLISEFLRSQSEVIVKVGLENTFQAVILF